MLDPLDVNHNIQFKKNMFLTIKNYFSVAPAQSEDLDHYKIFKPLYTVLSLFGLFPYSVKFNKVKHEFTIVRKSIYVNSLCAVSTMLFIYTFIGVHIQFLLSNNDSTLSDALLTQMNYILELDMLVLCSTIAYISSFTNRLNYVKILNDLSSVWIELKNDSSDQVLRSLRFHINVVVMGSLSIVFFLQILVNSTRHDSIWKIILVTFSFILPHIVQMVTLAFYYTLIVIVVSVLENANEHTMKFIKGSHNIPEKCIKVDDKLTIASLRQMEMVYAKAFEIKRDINAAFQAFILVTTVQCFHSIISEAFIIYHGIVLKTHDTHSFINCSVWILYQFLKIYSLAYSGNLLKDKVSYLDTYL